MERKPYCVLRSWESIAEAACLEESGKEFASGAEEADGAVVLWVYVLAFVFEDFDYGCVRPRCG